MRRKNLSIDTLLVHAGEKPDEATGAVAPILVRSKTFAQNGLGKPAHYQYSRGANPTREKLEEKLSVLEGGGQTTVWGSGVAATAMLFLTLSPGDHVLACQEVYGGTYRQLDQLFPRFGITGDYVDFNDARAIRSAIRPTTRMFFVETPTNPSLHVINLQISGRISQETRIPLVADMTFSPPCATRAFEFGVMTIVHSLSKYIAGHNDVIGGAIITRDTSLHEKLVFLHKTVGSILSPDECYRVLQGVKTLALRWRRASESALTVATWLASRSDISKVLYPGLTSHPHHRIAVSQMKGGFGAVLSFELRRQNKKSLTAFVEGLRSSGSIVYGESLASPETILAYPPLMSHKSLPQEVRESLGISDGFFRLSLGFEDPADIIRSLERGFHRMR